MADEHHASRIAVGGQGAGHVRPVGSWTQTIVRDRLAGEANASNQELSRLKRPRKRGADHEIWAQVQAAPERRGGTQLGRAGSGQLSFVILWIVGLVLPGLPVAEEVEDHGTGLGGG
jgi:hypothetical protein